MSGEQSHPSAIGSTSGRVSLDVVLACTLGVVGFFAGMAALSPYAVGVYHDDGIYVITARSIAEGDGYLLPSLPGSPPHTKYPVLYPAVLALVWKLWPAFPDNLLAMQGLSVVFAALAGASSYAYLVSQGYTDRWSAFFGVALAVLCPHWLFFARQTMSEPLFMVLLIAATWTLDRSLAARPRPGADILLGVLLGLPFLCRSIGVVLLISASFTLAVRAPRRLPWVWAGAAAAVLPWIVWSSVHKARWADDPIVGYYTDYLGWWADVWGTLPRVVISNVLYLGWYSIWIPPEALLVRGADGSPIPPLVFVGAALVGAAGYLTFFVRSSWRNALTPLLASYLLLVIFWPWLPDRFVVPILPMLLPFAAGFAMRVVAAVSSREVGLGVVAAASTVLLGFDLAYVRVDRERALAREYPQLAGWVPARECSWSDFEDAFDWIESNTPPDAVVASEIDVMVYAYAGRKAFRPFELRPMSRFYGDPYPDLGTVADLQEVFALTHPDYLLLAPIPPHFEDGEIYSLVAAVEEASPGLLTPVWTHPRNPGLVLYAVSE